MFHINCNQCPSHTHALPTAIVFWCESYLDTGMMKASLAILSLITGADAFLPAMPLLSGPTALSSVQTSSPVARSITRMGLSPTLTANFPRDFANVSLNSSCSDYLLR